MMRCYLLRRETLREKQAWEEGGIRASAVDLVSHSVCKIPK